MLFHVSEHLIELIFMPLSWLDTGDCSLRWRGASVFGGMWLIIGWWKGRDPNDSDGLSFECFAIDGSLSWGHRYCERGFLSRFFWGEILSIKTQISMKTPVCGGDFSPRIIEWSIHTIRESLSLVYKRLIIKHNPENKRRKDIFTWKIQFGKTTGRRRKIHYNISVYRNFR